MSRSKKVYLTMQQRVDVLKDLETYSIAYVAQKYGVHPKTIKRVQGHAAKIYNFAEQGKLEKRRRTFKQPTYKELEERLSIWFAERRAVGDAVSNALLIQKACQFKEELGTCSNFKLSDGWLKKFKRRYHIRLVPIYGEKASADEHGANVFVSNFIKYIEEEDINPENIYNMGETGLLWKSLPSRTLACDTERSASGYKMQKDRLTVGLCANATGTHKITPLVIHKYKNPRTLKDCMNELPVIYKAQSNACINQTIFVDWFENHFKKAVRQHQLENRLCEKVILLVDNCLSNKFPSGYEHDDNFKLKFLPPNTTSLIQPMDQGVIEKLKRRFRHQVSEHLIAHGYGIEDFFNKYTIKDCLHAISASWEHLTYSDLRNAWKKIIPNMQTVVKTEEDTITIEMQQAWSHISEHELTVEDIENYFTACSEEERRLSGPLEERVAEEEDEEIVTEEGDEERVAEEENEEMVAEEGDEERVAKEENEEIVAVEGYEEMFVKEEHEETIIKEENEEMVSEEGDEERFAEQEDEEMVAEEGDEERVAEEGDEEMVAEQSSVAEDGDRVNGINVLPKIRKDLEDCFKQLERHKKYFPPPVLYHLEGLKLSVFGYTTSKKRKPP